MSEDFSPPVSPAAIADDARAALEGDATGKALAAALATYLRTAFVFDDDVPEPTKREYVAAGIRQMVQPFMGGPSNAADDGSTTVTVVRGDDDGIQLLVEHRY